MPIIEFRSQCSDLLFTQIEAARGDVPRDEFLMEMLSIGLGHIQEEVLNQQRQQAYARLTLATNAFQRAIALTKVERPAPGANVTPFGSDVTRPKAVP